MKNFDHPRFEIPEISYSKVNVLTKLHSQIDEIFSLRQLGRKAEIFFIYMNVFNVLITELNICM